MRRQNDGLQLQQQGCNVLQAEKFNTSDEMRVKLKMEKLPSGYSMVKMALQDGFGQIASIRIEELDESLGHPIILRNITVYPDLHFRLHVSGVEVSLRHVAGLTEKSGYFQTTSEILNVLARLKSVSLNVKDLTTAATELLDRAGQADSDEFAVCQFASEQLRLALTPVHQRRYSPALMSLAVVWERTSPRLYQDLCQSAVLALPHRSTLRRLTSALSVKEGLEIGTIKYLKMRLEKLTERQRLVNLAMDEVYTARAIELAGGRVFGEGTDGVTNTIFCTLISSVAGNYEDTISMTPVPSITAEEIRDIFFKVLKTLTEIGFTVVSCTTDGHRSNQAFHNSLGQDGRHPEYICNPYRTNNRIFTMYDNVHIFKNFYYNLLNKKTLICPPFPGTQTPMKAEFSHLLKLHQMEQGTVVKMAYRLTDRVLHPTSLERVNVQLAMSAMHETTLAALRFYGQKEEYSHFSQTAEFLDLLRRWFATVNVRSSYTHVRLRDPARKPVRSDEKESLTFLSSFADMLRCWQQKKAGATKMSADTLQAAIYTCRGLVGLANYLLEKHGNLVHYVLLGKVQSDRIEGRFGYLRKLAGGNYWSSVRQFLEGEAVIRAKSLVWMSGYSLGTVASEMEEARQQRHLEDAKVVEKLVEAASCAEREDLNESTEQAIEHVAGYLARSVVKKHKCDGCHILLVDKNSKELTEVRLATDEEDEEGSSSELKCALQSLTAYSTVAGCYVRHNWPFG